MESSNKIALGMTTCGAVTGGLAGAKIGKAAEKKIIDSAKSIRSMCKDEFIAKKVGNQLGNLSHVKDIKGADGLLNDDIALGLIEKIRTKAGDKFEKFAKAPKGIIKAAKNTKIKWIAGLAAAGALLGTGVGMLIKHKADTPKEEA